MLLQTFHIPQTAICIPYAATQGIDKVEGEDYTFAPTGGTELNELEET